MSMQTIKTNLVMQAFHDYSKPGYPVAWRGSFSVYHNSHERDDKTSIFVRAVEIPIEVPDDFDPVPSQVAALMREKEKAAQEFAQKVAQINEQLARLQAIEHTEVA